MIFRRNLLFQSRLSVGLYKVEFTRFKLKSFAANRVPLKIKEEVKHKMIWLKLKWFAAKLRNTEKHKYNMIWFKLKQFAANRVPLKVKEEVDYKMI